MSAPTADQASQITWALGVVGALALIVHLGSAPTPEVPTPAPVAVAAPSWDERIAGACNAPFGKENLTTLTKAHNHGVAFGVSPLAVLSLRDGQTITELHGLADACNKAGV